MIITATHQTRDPLVVKAEAFHGQKSAMVFLWSGSAAHVALSIAEAEALIADLAPAIEKAKRIEAAQQAAA